jgi:UDP-N-acetylglucosamine acyltransferase
MAHHHLAVIDPRATIGANVVIEPFAHIEGDVVIGEGSWIGSHAVIKNGTRVGKNCQIFHGAVLGAVPQDLKFGGEETLLEIGHHTIVREYCTLNRGTKALGTTRVGAHCLLMAYVHIAHDCVIGDHCILANNVNLAGHIEVGDWAVLGGLTAVHQFVKIGAHAMLSGGSLVLKDVPPYIKAARHPLSYMGVNTTGLERRNFTPEQIDRIQDIYRILFVFNQNLAKALPQVAAEMPESVEKTAVLNFINASERGLLRGFQSVKD